ncbi:hypothetical protein QZH41_008916 [Actinostola sp. cb2023]|nr:hypothetical protein QZH41_008916 [Actinostola sp. cb2023]
MNREHKTLLRKNRVALVEDLEPRPVLNSLYQEGILSENDLELARSLDRYSTPMVYVSSSTINASFEAESGLSNRKGSNIDARNLQSLFLFLRYKVKLVENQRARNLKETVFKFAKEDHKNYDSVVVCLLSHGLEGQIYGVDGSLVSINDLVSMFNGNGAKTLVGKPKLFFVQACRGGEFDRGIGFERVDGLESAPSDERPVEEVLEELYASEQTDSGFVSPQSLTSEADFLLAFSTVPGFVSWRHSDKGSWFVQALVDVFKQYSSKEDIANMLIRINRKVALEFESTDKKKQMPAPVIMLKQEKFSFFLRVRFSSLDLVVSFAAVISVITQIRKHCVTTLITTAKETTLDPVAHRVERSILGL